MHQKKLLLIAAIVAASATACIEGTEMPAVGVEGSAKSEQQVVVTPRLSTGNEFCDLVEMANAGGGEFIVTTRSIDAHGMMHVKLDLIDAWFGPIKRSTEVRFSPSSRIRIPLQDTRIGDTVGLLLAQPSCRIVEDGSPCDLPLTPAGAAGSFERRSDDGQYSNKLHFPGQTLEMDELKRHVVQAWNSIQAGNTCENPAGSTPIEGPSSLPPVQDQDLPGESKPIDYYGGHTS